MPKLVKDGALVECNRPILPKDSALEAAATAGAQAIVPLDLWIAHTEALIALGITGVWVDSDQSVEPLRNHVTQLDLVAIRFPAFADGRGFSLGRLVRERFGFAGEIRAFGTVIQDQMHYLKRCGFNAMDLRPGTDLSSAIASLADFTEHYQAAVDQPKPLFRRRA